VYWQSVSLVQRLGFSGDFTIEARGQLFVKLCGNSFGMVQTLVASFSSRLCIVSESGTIWPRELTDTSEAIALCPAVLL